MNSIDIQYHKTKIGELILGSFGKKLCLLDFRYRRMRSAVDNRITRELNTEYLKKTNNLLNETKRQIDEYLIGKRIKFEVPILMVGSDFQKQVWNELLKVKYGETATYLDISKKIDNPKAVRAAASANGANAIALIIPCHRVIESNGGLGGYGGGLPVKKRLLTLEIENTILTDVEKYDFIGQKSTKHNHRFITAVKTTGIYCLPSCSAKKPNIGNIVFYKTKKEAIKNGFRSCKVCKP